MYFDKCVNVPRTTTRRSYGSDDDEEEYLEDREFTGAKKAGKSYSYDDY
jgi:hypothetical protein